MIRFGPIIIVILTLATYSLVPSFGFVEWDDSQFVINNALLSLPFLEFIVKSFGSYFFGDYVPLPLLTYWVEYQLFGLQPSYYHATNLLLHLLNVILLSAALSELKLKNEFVKIITLTIFALHPLQVETVTWISDRKSLLCLFFVLIWWRVTLKKNAIVSLPFFFASLLCKLTPLFLPFLIVKKRRYLLAYFLSITGLGAWRVYTYSQSTVGVTSSLFDIERLIRVPIMAFYSIAFYLKKLFLPIHLSAVYEFPVQTSHYLAPATVGFIVILVLSLFIQFQKSLDKKTLWFSLLWFLLSLLPTFQIVPRVNLVHDRYMYLPIIGVGLFLGTIASRLNTQLRQSLWIILIASTSVLSFLQTQVWKNTISLWTQANEVTPQNLLVLNALGLEHYRLQNYVISQKYFEEAIALPISDELKYKTLHNYALLLSEPNTPLMNLDKSEQMLLRAIASAQLRSQTYESRFNLAAIYINTNRIPLARAKLLDLKTDIQSESDQRYKYLLKNIESALESIKN